MNTISLKFSKCGCSSVYPIFPLSYHLLTKKMHTSTVANGSKHKEILTFIQDIK